MRSDYGLTAQQLADNIGCKRNTVYSWENNNSIPNGYLLVRLSEFFKLPPSYFTDGVFKNSFSLNSNSILGTPALCEHTAEQCCALAKSLLNFSRHILGSNDVTGSLPESRAEVLDNIASVEVCLDELHNGCEWMDHYILDQLKAKKAIEWRNRIM